MIDQFGVFWVLVTVYVVYSDSFNLVYYNLFQSLNRAAFDEFEQDIRLKDLHERCWTMIFDLRELSIYSFELAWQGT